MRNFIILFLLLLTSLTSCATTTFHNPQIRHRRMLYDNMVLEIHPTTQSIPNPVALNIFKAKMERFGVCRASNIRIITHDPGIVLIPAWTSSMLQAWEHRHRTRFDDDPDDRSLTVFVSYVTGIHTRVGYNNIVGLKYDDTSIAIFFRNYAPMKEACVLIHEVGHVIGLVDRECREGDPANPDRPSHCNNENCVMFWQIKGSPDFDSLCQRDILSLNHRQ